MEKPSSAENLDYLSSNISDLSLEEASRELRSRLNGAERGVVEIDGKKFTTVTTHNEDLLYVIGLKNPEATKEFLEKTKEGREVLYKKASKYLIDLWDNVFEENKDLFKKPTKREIIEQVFGLSEDFSDFMFEAFDVLDENLSALMSKLHNGADSIYDKLHYNYRGPDDEEITDQHYRWYVAYVEILQAAVLALKASRLE